VADAGQRFKRRHARRVVRFFERAERGRIVYRENQLRDRMSPHQDEWDQIAERNRAGVV
jgi:hypothetical protein